MQWQENSYLKNLQDHKLPFKSAWFGKQIYIKDGNVMMPQTFSRVLLEIKNNLEKRFAPYEFNALLMDLLDNEESYKRHH